MSRISQATAIAVLAWAAAAAAPAVAQTYPSAPIHIICGFSPGTTADISARVVGAKMSKILGQQVVVENRLGASSSIAAASVAGGAKDGYTLFIGSAANLINAAMRSDLKFDFVKDFAPIALLSSTPTVLVVNPEVKVSGVKELIALAKGNPNAVLFGSAGVGSSTHLALELFKSLAAVQITHVPYSGSPPVVTDLLAGRLSGYFAPASTVMGFVQAGKLRALAVTDVRRSPAFPELPTMIEAGVPDFESSLWFGLMAPAGTPQPIVDKLARAATEALKSDEVVEAFKKQTMVAGGGSPDDFRRYIEKENIRWSTLVKNAGLKQ